jgi:predicted dehydrogenase
MRALRFAVFGAGFWTRYQLAAWRELKGVTCAAIYNRTPAKAEALAREFGIPAVYSDPEELLRRERPDFVDNITEVNGHKPLSLLALQHQIPVICQKPLAPSLADAEAMAAAARRHRVPLLVHENWRWQTPIRAAHALLRRQRIGTPFRARIDMLSGFECWSNQPALRELDQFILTDLGTHILDVARFLFGEARSLYCTTRNTLPKALRGENVATVMMKMGPASTTVICQMAYALTPLERECFPQTLLFIEGDRGSIELRNDYWVRLTTRAGTHARRYPPPRYAWANPAYDIVHASIVPCLANLLAALRGTAPAATTAEDNLQTLRLVHGAYASARTGRALSFA